MPMPQQLSQIPILPTRYPDLGKTILHQQLQNMLRILPIRLLLAFALPSDLSGVSDPQLTLQLGQYPPQLPTLVCDLRPWGQCSSFAFCSSMYLRRKFMVFCAFVSNVRLAHRRLASDLVQTGP